MKLQKRSKYEKVNETTENEFETVENEEITNNAEDEETVDSVLDEEFMSDIKEEPLTAEKYQKKKDSLLALINDCKQKIEDYEDLHQAAASGVLKILKGKLKDVLQANLNKDYEDVKELKDGIKDLEALNITSKLLGNSLMTYNLAKSDLSRYENELEDLENQARQLTLFNEIKKETV